MHSLTLMTSDLERHCWVGLGRLGYDGSVVFSCQGYSVVIADCDVTLDELAKAGVSPQESAMTAKPQRHARLQH